MLRRAIFLPNFVGTAGVWSRFDLRDVDGWRRRLRHAHEATTMTFAGFQGWIMSQIALKRALWMKRVRLEQRRRRHAAAEGATRERGYASYKEAQAAEVQRAFERARRGEGLFGLKDAEYRH